MTDSITFDDFVSATQQLANKVSASGFRPSMLIAVARGGWIPTRLLSDFLNVKRISSIGLTYSDLARTQLTTYSLPSPLPTANDTVLLIEDCLESGKSLAFARKMLMNHGAEVKTAAVFVVTGAIAPDFSVRDVSAPPHFPWEVQKPS